MIRKIIMPVLLLLFILALLGGQDREPILYLEFQDFSKFLTEMRNKKQYREFMGSSVMEWYRNTRLGLKFPKRLGALEEVLGFSLSLKNIETLAGEETGIWVFDIGELKLLMITRMSESDYLRSKVSQLKDHFGEGRIDSITYYFKKDQSGSKEVDFAFVGGYFILSNEPAEFEFFLTRLLKDGDFKGWKENDFLSWLDPPAEKEYDMLLYLSSESVRNTYFTSYWFYNNQKAIREWFDKGVIYLKKGDKKIEEKHIFNIVDGFVFDSLALVKTKELFSITPKSVDMVRILPVYGDELAVELKRILGNGKAADSLSLKVEQMNPLVFGSFVRIQKGKILPELEEGLAIVVETPNGEINKLFERMYPVTLRNSELFLKNIPEFVMNGNILFFSNGENFFAVKQPLKKGDISFYSWLNLAAFGKAFAEEIALLGESERWRSYENRDFFKGNIADLIRISSSYIETVEKTGKVQSGILTEEIIYHTGK